MLKLAQKHLALIMVWLICSAWMPPVAAAERGTAEEAIALVHSAAAFLKTNGLPKLIDEVNNPKGQFRDRDLYLTVADLKGVNLAHGANPKIKGVDLINVRDADGKYFVKERIEMLKTKNSGWVNYTWVNPANQQMEHKSMYFERFGDISIQCGIWHAR